MTKCSRHLAASFVIATLVLHSIVCWSVAQPEELPSSSQWPQFRGSNVDGISAERGVFKESITLEVGWKIALGSGYSSVSVNEGLAVTMFDDGTANVLLAVDADTGQERWRFPLSPSYKGHNGSFDGPLSTPLVTSDQTVALGPAGRLVAVRNSDGAELWSTHVVKEHNAPEPLYGFATSPILEGGKVILQIGGEQGAVAGFDLKTGRLAWRSGKDTVDYQNPVPIVRGNDRYVLAAGFEKVIGLEPANGKVLWEAPHGGGGARGVWSMVPVVTGEDWLFLAFKDTASAQFKLDGPSDDLVFRKVWEERSIRNSYAVAVYHEGYLYAYSSRFLTCVDAVSGKAVWKSRAPGDGFLILVDGHLVIQTKDGSLHVAKASPEGYQEIASLDLFSELAWAPPSFADGSIFVRSLKDLARVNVRRVESVLPVDEAASSTSESSGNFASFLDELKDSTDKERTIDAFIESQSSFPIIEDARRVHFLYRGGAQDVAIAGDMIGSRQEAPMTRVDETQLFYYTTELRPDARVNYLFIKDFEFITDPLNPRRTRTALMSADMEVADAGNEEEMEMSWLAMPDWKSPAYLEEPTVGQSRGRLEKRQLRSEILGVEHTLNVYLPHGYDEADARYPVIYFHGGTGALKRGNWQNSLDNLIDRSVAPIMVVFIEPVGGDLFDERDKYGEFWAREIAPYVDGNFRTRQEPSARAHVGGSRSAHDALHCAMRYPERSQRVAVQSLTMVEFGRTRLEPLVPSADQHRLDIYVEWGLYDLHNPQEAWDMREVSRNFATFLKERGHRVTTNEVPDGTGWSSWKYRNQAVLEHLFPAGGSSTSRLPRSP